MLACDLAQYVTSASTVISAVAAAVVLVLRELRFKHPMDTAPDANENPQGSTTP